MRQRVLLTAIAILVSCCHRQDCGTGCGTGWGGLLVGAVASEPQQQQQGKAAPSTVVGANDDDDGGAPPPPMWPRIEWAQRRSMLYVRVVTPDLQPGTVDVHVNDTHLTFQAQGRGGEWSAHFNPKECFVVASGIWATSATHP